MSKLIGLFCLSLLFLNIQTAKAEDERIKVDMPAMMRDHMLGNMRDHLKALDEIFLALSQGQTSVAAKIAENRLGMSSTKAHGAAHMAPFMPENMRTLGTNMHRAASQFAQAIELSDLEPITENQLKIYQSFQNITANCTACHETYRVH